MRRPHLLCLSEPKVLAQHDEVIYVPITLTGTKTMEPDLIIFVHIRHEAVLGSGVERSPDVVPIFSDARETNTQQRFRIVDHGIDGLCRF